MKNRQGFCETKPGLSVKFVFLCSLWTGLLLNFCQGTPNMWEWGTSYPRLKYMPLSWPKVTVSGISTGGAKALHLYLAHSNIVDGIAIFAGVQHRCGDASSGKMSGFYECFHGMKNLSHLIETAEDFQSANLIDPLSNLAHGRQYVEHGRNDEVINVRVGRQTGQFLGKFSRNVLYHESKAIHGMATKSCGFPCMAPFYFNSGCLSCGYSGVYEGLSHVYGRRLQEFRHMKVSECKTAEKIPGLFKVDQSEFLPENDERVSMAYYAYIYVPPQCRADSSRCTLHIAFHGCFSKSVFGGVPTFITCSGYLDVAAANNIIILFPQTTWSVSDPFSLAGCWDVAGYTGMRGNQHQCLTWAECGSLIQTSVQFHSKFILFALERFKDDACLEVGDGKGFFRYNNSCSECPEVYTEQSWTAKCTSCTG